MRGGKLDDVVHCDATPGSERDVEGLEEPERLVSWCLDTTALVARADIRAHIPSDSRPGVVALDELEGRTMIRMTCRRRIVAKAKIIST